MERDSFTLYTQKHLFIIIGKVKRNKKKTGFRRLLLIVPRRQNRFFFFFLLLLLLLLLFGGEERDEDTDLGRFLQLVCILETSALLSLLITWLSEDVPPYRNTLEQLGVWCRNAIFFAIFFISKIFQIFRWNSLSTEAEQILGLNERKYSGFSPRFR